jgi:hypothetical protein
LSEIKKELKIVFLKGMDREKRGSKTKNAIGKTKKIAKFNTLRSIKENCPLRQADRKGKVKKMESEKIILEI